MMFRRTTTLILCLLITVAEFTVAEDALTPVKQTTCPVMGDPVDSSIYTDYKGKRVYFCCKMCLGKFKKNPEKYIAKLPQFNKNNPLQDYSIARETTTISGSRRLLRFLGKFHPVAIHIPIALVLVAALAEILAVLTNNSIFSNASRFNIIIALPSVLVSVLLGLAASKSSNYPYEFLRSLFIHKWLGLATCASILITTILSELACLRGNHSYKQCYRAVLFISVILVMLTGFFGGKLVFGLNHYAW